MGWVNASWPFAKLSASRQQLVLSSFGSYTFEPQQVVALEPHGSIPIFARGIRIVHSRSDLPAKIVFWCFGSPERLIARIRDTGLMPQGTLASIPKRNGIPVRLLAMLVAFVVWNGLFLLDNPLPLTELGEPGWFSLLAIGLLCATAWALPYSNQLQSLLLKPGCSFGEIRAAVFLVRLISSILFVAFLVQQIMK